MQYPTLESEWHLPGINFVECPIRVSLGVLGKKWTLLVLRDIGIFGVDRFNRILDFTPGLTPSPGYALKRAGERGIHPVHREGKATYGCCQMGLDGEGKRRFTNLVTICSLWLKVARRRGL